MWSRDGQSCISNKQLNLIMYSTLPDGTGFDGMRAARFKGLWTVAGLALCKSRQGTDESTALVVEETPGLKGS